MKIKFGPSGLGSIKNAEEILKNYSKLGLKACEIAFTYGVYIKNKEDALRIGKIAKKLEIDLSIHAPYWINLNSNELKKIESSKKRILDCCQIGNWIGAKRIIFHPGYFGKNKEFAFENIRLRIKEILKDIKKNKWKIELCPEIMGKVNVFGSPEEISNLVKETGCSFCIDFAHVLAREKKIDWKKIKKLFPCEKWHVHFSGIEYGEKGEKRHKNLEKKQWKELLENLPSNKETTIICESPDRIRNSLEGLEIWKSMKK